MVTDLAAGDVVLIKLPADTVNFDENTIALDMVDTLEGDGAAMTPPTLLGWTEESADFPGAALQVAGDAEDGDTFFAAISPTPSGTIISNTAIFALVVGEESKACVHWGDADNWNCGGGALVWILVLLAVAAGAYFFLM